MSFVVVDYSKGNLRSVQKGLQLAGAEAVISQDPADINAAQAIVLPGVGSFADASAQMLVTGQMQAIRERIAAGVPFLGICLGLQLLFERGDEGVSAGSEAAGGAGADGADDEAAAAAASTTTAPENRWAEGLGILKGYCRRIDSADGAGNSVKVPHVGWNQVRFCDRSDTGLSALFTGIEDGSNFYFTHSYQCVPTNAQDVLATVVHATEFACVVRQEHVFGIQFHPEKSSQKGLTILKNFVAFVTAKGR